MNIQKEITLFADPDVDPTAVLHLAEQLELAITQAPSVQSTYLHFQSDRLGLVFNNEVQKPVTFQVDFVHGKSRYRAQKPSAELLIQAIKIKKKLPVSVVDGTGGLGRDAFLLAAAGCTVEVFEKNKIVAALLEDGLRRARAYPEYARITQRINLHRFDMTTHLVKCVPEPVVIYLDPMFPQRTKTAKVKQDMQVLQQLISAPEGAEQLLKTAWGAHPHKIVVKRPIKQGPILDLAPSYTVSGKAIRFDVYFPATFPEDIFKNNDAP